MVSSFSGRTPACHAGSGSSILLETANKPFVPLHYWRQRVPRNGTINGIKPQSADEYWEEVGRRHTREVFRKAAAQGWLCFYCWLPLEPDRKKIVREHRIPRSKGGKGGKNIVASCIGCDKHKHDDTWPPARYIRQRRRGELYKLGLYSARHRVDWPVYPNFGRGLDGERLWCPQYGLV